VPDALRRVEPHVGERLPQEAVLPEQHGRGGAQGEDRRHHHREDEDPQVGDEQLLDDIGRNRRAEARAAALIPASVHLLPPRTPQPSFARRSAEPHENALAGWARGSRCGPAAYELAGSRST
jgi:hypothetical protein